MNKKLVLIIIVIAVIVTALTIVIIYSATKGSSSNANHTPAPTEDIRGYDPDGGIFMDLAHGDIDGDGEVSDWDAMMFERYLSNWNNEVVLDQCDIDGNGEINDWDYVIFTRYLTGWRVSLPTALPKEETPSAP